MRTTFGFRKEAHLGLRQSLALRGLDLNQFSSLLYFIGSLKDYVATSCEDSSRFSCSMCSKHQSSKPESCGAS